MARVVLSSVLIYLVSLLGVVPGTPAEANTAGSPRVHILLVSSTVRDAEVLAEAASDGVVVVRYRASDTSLADVVAKVREALDGRKASSIGLAMHDHGAGRFYLTGSHSISLASTLASDREQAFWRELGTMVAPGGRIDIFACDLAATDEGRLLLSALVDAAGVEVAASSNPTGNASSGGDWLLETAGIDAAETYFDSKMLARFTGLLAALEQKVVGGDTDANDMFGDAIDIDGDYAIVGAMFGDGCGSAYIFHRSGTTWTQQAKLSPNDGGVNDYFGDSVAISGDYAVVGAHGNDYSMDAAGAAYVFYKDQGGPGNWGQQVRLVASDPSLSAGFGKSVSIDGDRIVVGAPWSSPAGSSTSSGSAYVFYKDEGGENNWGQKAQIYQPTADSEIGYSVGISGDTAIIGARNDNTKGSGAGAIYICEKDKGGPDIWGWELLTLTDAAAGDYFGCSVDISGDYAVIGAFNKDSIQLQTGVAYVFYRHQNGPDDWGQFDKLTAGDAAHDDHFGTSVSISGDHAIVGADRNDDAGNASGSAYVFRRSGSFWTRVTKLTASDADTSDYFGCSVAIEGGWALVGANMESAIASNSGSAYFYDGAPGITSPAVVGIGNSTATLGGTVTHTGWDDLTARGVVWSRNPGPTLASNNGSATSPGGVGAFTVSAKGLWSGTTYYFRAYATSDHGTVYTDDATFTTGSITTAGSLRVTLTPNKARGAGAGWKLSGGSTWFASGYTLTGLNAGEYTVVFKQINGWITPQSRTLTIASNQVTAIEASYAKKETSGEVKVSFTSPSAILSGVRWRIKGAAKASTPPVNYTRWRESGESIALEAGTYIVEFLPAPGWVHTDVTVKLEAGKGVEIIAEGIPFLVSACTDFDGDGHGDIACFNPTTRVWTVKDGLEERFGLRGSWPAAGDYDGDGVADLAYWRPKNGIWRVRGQFKLKGFGMEGDLPVPGDYDGDGYCDPALYRPSTGEWMLNLSGDASAPGKADVTVIELGGNASDIPVPADYNGDGKTNAAVHNLATHKWRIAGDSNVTYGRAGELPVPGDFDGDGASDLAVIDLRRGWWRVRDQFILDVNCEPGHFPILLDHNGDGLPEPGYYCFEDGRWHVFTFGNEPGQIWVLERKISFGDETVIPLSHRR